MGAYGGQGRPIRAKQHLTDEALSLMERGEDHLCDTELHRAKGELQLIQDGEEFPAEACVHYDITYEACERVFNLLRNAKRLRMKSIG